MRYSWPERLPVVQLRITRQTSRLQAMVEFYHHGLGLPIIFQYQGHAGYDGVMLGLPGRDYHLELVQHTSTKPGAAPDPDNLLVFYLSDHSACNRVAARLAAMGHHPLVPANPYWATQGLTIADPDNWRIVLMATHGFGSDIDSRSHG